MKKIEILGMGCAKCHKLEEDVWDVFRSSESRR
jgi:hypothetical protein